MLETSARAAAHPLRRELLRLLAESAVTATEAAAALDTNSGATSFHLRQLHRRGLVEPAGGDVGRERRWRLADTPEAMDLRDDDRYDVWRSRADAYARPWRGQGSSSYRLLMTAAERRALAEQILDLVEPYFARDTDRSLVPRGARPVVLATRLFPDFDPS